MLRFRFRLRAKGLVFRFYRLGVWFGVRVRAQ